MCSDLEREQYGFTTEQNEGELNAELPEPNRTGLRYEYDILEGWEHIMEAGVQDTVSYVQEVNWPGALNQFVNRRRG